MGWAIDAINWLLLTLGDAAQWLWHDGLGYVGAVFGAVGEVANVVLAPLVSWVNVVINAVFGVVFAPIAKLPGWSSNTIIAAVAGVGLLWVYKHTSNQGAIGRVRDRIKADMLAAKLYKDELHVTFRSQRRLLIGAFKLLGHSLRPMAVMIVPVSLLLAQMGLWYQWRPLAVGEETLVTVALADGATDDMPDVTLATSDGDEIVTGPVRIPATREVCWQIRATQPGHHTLGFRVGDQTITKELVVGDGLARVCPVRPGWAWTSILLYPLERPLSTASPIRTITIDYPTDDTSWTVGSDWWLVYFFIASMVVAVLVKPLMKVRI